MDNIELLICLIETEINKLDYKIKLVKNAEDVKKSRKYNSEKAGLKRALRFIEEIENMED